MKTIFKCTTTLIGLLICSICFTGKQTTHAQLPQKFKVAVLVDCDNANAKTLMESYIKRELRSLGDVQLVANEWENALWNNRINVLATESKYEDGRSTGSLALTYSVYEIVSHTYFNAHSQERYKKFPVIYIPTGTMISYWPIDDLDTFCKTIVAKFDTRYLQHVRDLR